MDELSWTKELDEYNFCLHEDGNVTQTELIFEDPEEMFTFIRVCLRNGIEFSVNKYHEVVVVDAEE